MFLKENIDITIKYITAEEWNKKRDFIFKEDSSSPTISNKYMLFSCLIDAEDKRDVAVIYIPNTLIQTRVEK